MVKGWPASAQPQIQKLRSGVEIVVACPGRLLDHINQRNIKLDRLEVLESTAEAVINSRVLGEVKPMNDAVIEELVKVFLS